MTSSSSKGKKGHKGEYHCESPNEWQPLVPHTIYFYYFSQNSDGTYDNDFYFVHDAEAPIPQDQLLTRIEQLVVNAAGSKSTPAPETTKFGECPWNRISWLVVAVEGEKFGSKGAVEIKWKKESGGEDQNHSFFDGGETIVTLDSGDEVGVLWVWNHMRDPDGELLDDVTKKNKFRFKFKSVRVLGPIDENGTNTGPTVRPPPTGVFPPVGGPGHGGGSGGDNPG